MRERETDRQTETESERHTERDTQRERERERIAEVQACLGYKTRIPNFCPSEGFVKACPVG